MENLNLESLSFDELVDLVGGGFWYDVSYAVGAFLMEHGWPTPKAK